jgi:hypothetical protein
MTDAPPIIIDEDAAIDSAFFGSHAGRTCYDRAFEQGWFCSFPLAWRVESDRRSPRSGIARGHGAHQT